MTNIESLPLAGIRVLEFTHAVMGPATGLILADMGAEVIRIEPAPDGDHTRRLKGFGTGYHTFFNRNKKSLVVNVKEATGLEIVRRLLPSADALIENFAFGTMERLGLGYEQVKEIAPALIYCRLKGFMEGPYVRRTALDEVVQMMSGLAYMTGPPGQPLRAGASIVDIMGGTFGALGILLSLRQREETGKGGLVSSGLFETAAFIMGQHMAYGAIADEPVPPMPARVSPWAVYRLFTTQEEAMVFVGITSDKHWQAFCREFQRPDLLADISLATNNQRIAERERLHDELERFFATMTLAEIMERCERAQIPFSPVAHPENLFDDPHLVQGNSLVETILPDGRRAPLPRLPLALDGQRAALRDHAPATGAHTAELLSELGYSDDEVAQLHQKGIVTVSRNSYP